MDIIAHANGIIAKAIKNGKLVRPDYCEQCGRKCKPDATSC